jgi:hypothetical protein
MIDAELVTRKILLIAERCLTDLNVLWRTLEQGGVVTCS